MKDLISRQDAIEAIDKHIDTFDAIDANYLDGLRTAMSLLRELPSVQLERPKGKWIPFEFGDESWHQCTACGVADKYIDYVKGYDGKTGKLVSVRNYCPNCGADMRGE